MKNEKIKKIIIGGDPGGFDLKNAIRDHLAQQGYDITDVDPESPDLFQNVAVKVAKGVQSGTYDRGIAICGTGVGIAMAAGKVKGIRACVCSEPCTARLSRMHNDSNVLAFGARIIGMEMAKMITDAWLDAEYEGGRHQRRIYQLMEIENR